MPLLPGTTMATYYKIDSSRVTLREYAFGTPWYELPIAYLLKLFRVQIPGSTDEPPVEALGAFEVPELALPPEVRAEFEPLTRELEALGFHSPIYHLIPTPLQSAALCWATFLHRDGKTVARIHHRRWASPMGPRLYFFPQFFTLFDDGTWLVSSAGKPDMLTPEACAMHYHVGASPRDLWAAHQEAVAEALPRRPVSIGSQEALREQLERRHALVRDFHLQRGVFRPLPEREQKQAAELAEAADPARPGKGPSDAEVLVQLEQLQNARTSWWNTLLILVVSMALFAGAGQAMHDWDQIWLLIPILAFHELGHYVAMRLFGYRNLRMFFIPLFGAAVSGRHYNVAGWKKALVALAGPVPGIALGVVLGGVGLFLGHLQLIQAAVLMLALNGFNLLPMLPLDGGWVAHAVLFQRHPLLDTAFRLLAIVALVGLSVWSGDRILFWVGLFMLIGLPMSWRLASVVHRLRPLGLGARSPDGQSIPPEIALPILAEVRTVMPEKMNANLLAQQVASVFEMLNARPPGVLASLGLLFLHGASFVVAAAGALLFFLGQGGDLVETALLVSERPAYEYTPGSVQEWHGLQAPAAPVAGATLLATFGKEREAQREFDALSAELPPWATLVRFGQMLLLALPGEHAADSKQWANLLRQRQATVVVATPETPVLFRLFCVARGEDAAKRLADELRGCLGAPGYVLIPPWSPAWEALPAAERERFTRARQTKARLDRLTELAYKHPEVTAAQQEMNQLFRNGDMQAAMARTRQVRDVVEAERQRLLEALRTEEGLDPEVIDLWQRRWKRMQAWGKQSAKAEAAAAAAEPERPEQDQVARLRANEAEQIALDKQLLARQGVLPLEGGEPRPGSDGEAIRHGSVRHKKAYVLLTASFQHPTRGLPAVAEWLARQGCVEIRFGLVRPDDEDGPAEDEAP